MSPLAKGVLLGCGAAVALAASYTLQAREARRVETAARPSAALVAGEQPSASGHPDPAREVPRVL